MAARAYTIKGLNRALRQLGPEASKRLRDASVEIAGKVADDARSRALRGSGAARLMAPSIKGTRDRVPAVRQGSSRRLPPRQRSRADRSSTDHRRPDDGRGVRRRSSAVDTRQFLPWRGSSSSAGYALYPAVRENAESTGEAYSAALDDALQAI